MNRFALRLGFKAGLVVKAGRKNIDRCSSGGGSDDDGGGLSL